MAVSAGVRNLSPFGLVGVWPEIMEFALWRGLFLGMSQGVQITGMFL